METIENLKKLLELKNKYIEFLGQELANNASFLYTHGITCSQEVIDKGEELRNKMKKLEENM